MTHEIVPDTPCPHCERQNTTLRRSIEEDGFTKVSRICTACGGEWTHTWDRDWLADAKNRKLRAENDRLRTDRRERIATAALQGLLAYPETQGTVIDFAQMSVRYADALIAELDKEDKP